GATLWHARMEAADLERRRLVWKALSDLFLDTETRWYFPRIALVLARSGYSRRELTRIWRHEIVPECAGNLMQVAGEWAALALDEPALIRRASRWPSLAGWILSAPVARLLRPRWQQLLALWERLSPLPDPEREPLANAWSAFAHAYLERSLAQV